MINIDELYKQVEQPDITKDEIIKIVDTIERGTSFDNSKYSETNLFIKIASLPLSDPKLVTRMFHILRLVDVVTNGDFNGYTTLLNYGSKEEFDKIWERENIKHMILDSKHCWGGQLQDYYNTEVSTKKAAAMGATWVKNITSRILRNPNCPDDIYMSSIKKMGDFYMPIIITKTALPENVLSEIKHYISYRDDNCTLFNTFVTTSKLSWKKISEVITFDYFFIPTDYKKTLNRLGKTRLSAFKLFCQRDDCPGEIKLKMFEWTSDGDFLSKEAKDVFVF